MIKANIISPLQVANKYPYLGINLGFDCVILFTSPNTGTVVNGGRSADEVGFHYDEWKEETFSKFLGVVQLENEE